MAQVRFVDIGDHQNLDNLIQDLPKMTNLEALTLRHCRIDNGICIAYAIANLGKLKHIDLQYNCIGERGWNALIPVFRALEEAALFYVQGREDSVGNQMSITNLKELVWPIPLSDRSELPKERIGRDIYWKAGILMIQVMNLSDMNLGDEGAIILANSFSIMERLTQLLFYNSGVGAVGARAFAMNLPNARVLEYLCLAMNYIPPECNEDFDMMNQSRQAKGLNLITVDVRNQMRDESRQALELK